MSMSQILAIVLGFVVALDHTLAAIPSIKASSTFQMISNVVLALAGIGGNSDQPK